MNKGDLVPSKIARVAMAALALAFVACSQTSRPVRAASERKAAPDFTLKDSNGTSVKLSDYRGKVVLLNFWATWCGPCKIEIPWFVEFEQKFKDQGFAVLGVSMDEEGWDIVKPYITDRKVNYRVLMGNDAIAQVYGGVDSLPTTFLIDREGRIASTHIGLVSKSTYQNEILQLFDNSKRVTRNLGMPDAAGGTE
jgi:peroxiredoxin